EYTWTGASSTAWGTSTNWSPAGIPTSSDTVTIPSGALTPNDPTIATGAQCSSLTVLAGGILNGGSGTLRLEGDWKNSGIFNKGTSVITTAKDLEIDDPTNNFNNITIQSGKVSFKNPITAAHTWPLAVAS